MKYPVYGINGKVKGEVMISTKKEIRADLIHRAVVAEQSLKRQPYGADPMAGKRTSAHYHGRRSVRYSMMNREMARMARIHGSGFLHMTARFVPQAIKGRKAHPPKAEKIWEKKINEKEWKKALIFAIIACMDIELVKKRGHRIDKIKQLPLVVEDKIEEIKKAKEIVKILKELGLEEEIKRVKERKIRAGKGTRRGRKYKEKKGPLIVIKKDKGLRKAAENIPGVEVKEVKNLCVEDLAPGTHPGRLTIWTEGAIEWLKDILGE